MEDIGPSDSGGSVDSGGQTDSGGETDTGQLHDSGVSDTGASDDVPPADSQSDQGSVEPISFAKEIHVILVDTCTGAGCHESGAGGYSITGSVNADYQATLEEVIIGNSDGSKLLKKASNTSSHDGGPITPVGSADYELIAEWIDGGAKP